MLPCEEHSNMNIRSSSSSSFSSTSSSRSLSPLLSPSSHLFTTQKTMEEVWRDINNSTNDVPPSINQHYSHFRGSVGGGNGGGGIILQDFLARPFSKEAPTNSIDFPPPLENSRHVISNYNNGLVDEDNLVRVPSCFGMKKRLLECNNNTGENHRRNKRMIKNRESAARSRARKQECLAYTNELELEVAQLMEENAKLKRQQEQVGQLYMAAAAAQVPKKHTTQLHRASTF